MSAESPNQGHQNIESAAEVQKFLEEIGKEQLLIVHQTHLNSAKKITFEDEYFSDCGLVGTALIKNVSSIMATSNEMIKPASEQHYGTIHKGADCQLIMTFPKKIASELMQNINLNGIDDYLVDEAAEGRNTQWGMPAKFILGYIHEGQLVLNPRYSNE